MAALWPLRPRSLHADFCAGERVMGINQNTSASNVMTRAYPLRPRSLHADSHTSKRVTTSANYDEHPPQPTKKPASLHAPI
ncbi:Putative protein without homology [Lacticaseibacillus rhamnosus GG]|nr:Putative protein without homology [Lacticaseibacillus rhamnosus GG]